MRRVVHPYVDRGRPGELRYESSGDLPLVKDPPMIPRQILTLQSLRRHNTLRPELVPTHRVLLRWGDGGGNGIPNVDADVRELHFDPLPIAVQEKVDAVVSGSPWETLTRKWYRTTLTGQQLADLMCISRTQLYEDWRNSLWYFRGRFEAEGLND